MSKLTIKDFKIGDGVYHLTNPPLKMIVIEIMTGNNEIKCRWIDKNGKIQIFVFLVEELGKRDN